MKEKIFFASDHGAFNEKTEIMQFVKEQYPNCDVVDLGTYSDASCNYAEFAIKLAKSVVEHKARGILFCGSGIGASIAANRFAGVRAALCRTVEEARLSRLHNDSNVLTMGGRITPVELMQEMVEIWFSTEFEEGRHIDRIATFNHLGEKL